MNCGMYRGLKLLEHVMKTVENVLQKKIENNFRYRWYTIWFYNCKRYS